MDNYGKLERNYLMEPENEMTHEELKAQMFRLWENDALVAEAVSENQSHEFIDLLRRANNVNGEARKGLLVEAGERLLEDVEAFLDAEV